MIVYYLVQFSDSTLYKIQVSISSVDFRKSMLSHIVLVHTNNISIASNSS